MSYTDITAKQLVDLTKVKSDYFLIDCRSFLVYNKGHISGAANIRCNSIMKRRNKGVLTLENALTNGDVRNAFASGRFSNVIAYDDQGGNLETDENQPPKSRRTLSMVVEVLQKNAPHTTLVTYLNCGFKEFSRQFPEHCTGVTCATTDIPMQQDRDIPTSLVTPIYDQGAPVEILPHLYLGSAHHASQKSQLLSLGITAVLNASSTCLNYFESDFKYNRIPVEDNNHTDISLWFNEAITFINSVEKSQGKVLVHCHAGISRSATLCLAYLIACHKVSLSEAFHYVKRRRNVISPNFNFMGQLMKFEADVAARDGRHVTSSMSSCFDFTVVDHTAAKVLREKRPRSQNLQLTMPLASKIENMDTEHVCLTAPARIKEFSFYIDPKRSCSQETTALQSHSMPSHLTLST